MMPVKWAQEVWLSRQGDGAGLWQQALESHVQRRSPAKAIRGPAWHGCPGAECMLGVWCWYLLIRKAIEGRLQIFEKT